MDELSDPSITFRNRSAFCERISDKPPCGRIPDSCRRVKAAAQGLGRTCGRTYMDIQKRVRSPAVPERNRPPPGDRCLQAVHTILTRNPPRYPDADQQLRNRRIYRRYLHTLDIWSVPSVSTTSGCITPSLLCRKFCKNRDLDQSADSFGCGLDAVTTDEV